MNHRELFELLRNNSELSIQSGLDTQAMPQPVPWSNEREFMRAVIAECDLRSINRPEYGLVYHISNENAHRNPGVRGGMPDLHLPSARNGYHSLYIELKVRTGKPSRAQVEMLGKLRMEGNKCIVVWDSVAEVMEKIEEYLE